MSRRCDREGVPRSAVLHPYERFLVRAGATCDVLWELAEWRMTYGRGSVHNEEILAHLRERPMLPPWVTVAGERGSRG